MSDNNYNPNLQGSNSMPSSDCDAPVSNDTANDVQKARDAVKLHKVVNDLAERGNRR